MKRKCLSKLMAGALAVTIMTSSALSVEAAGSGYSGSGYVNTPVSAVSDIEMPLLMQERPEVQVQRVTL